MLIVCCCTADALQLAVKKDVAGLMKMLKPGRSSQGSRPTSAPAIPSKPEEEEEDTEALEPADEVMAREEANRSKHCPYTILPCAIVCIRIMGRNGCEVSLDESLCSCML